jgi:hypothetical protein
MQTKKKQNKVVTTKQFADILYPYCSFTVREAISAIESKGLEIDDTVARGRLREFFKAGLLLKTQASPCIIYQITDDGYLGLIELHDKLIFDKLQRDKKPKGRGRPSIKKETTPHQFWSKAGIKCKAGERVVMMGSVD